VQCRWRAAPIGVRLAQ